jgi:YYY domain-containing protein
MGIENSSEIKNQNRYPWIWTILLLGVLMLAAYFRFSGIDWDDDHHLHPDERFMTMVASSISSVDGLSEYFDTANSSLNPNNRGYGFYVYGTLPLFIVRYAAEMLNQAGYSEIHLVGRFFSGLFDLLTVLMVFLIAVRLFRNYRLALLAALFSALAVLQIQLSHYFTVDTYTNFFTFLAFYFAVRVMTDPQPVTAPVMRAEVEPVEMSEQALGVTARIPAVNAWSNLATARRTIIPYAFFGAALGLAMASKVSSAPLAVLLPGAALIVWSRLSTEERQQQLWIIARNLVLAAAVAFLVFRIFQPYAFTGPGFFNVTPNENWLNSMKALAQQSGGDVDFPPALQWARRPLTFAWQNMVQWGLGLPLGLLAWAGFMWMGVRMLKGEWRKYALLWGWTLLYFAWQSLNFSRSMRYQLPVYPALAIIAAWAIFALWSQRSERVQWRRWLAAGLGIVVVGATLAWAAAFSQIYTRPITRIAASEWIYQNIPAAVNLRIETDEGLYNQPLSTRLTADFSAGAPLVMSFEAQYSGVLGEADFAYLRDLTSSGEAKSLLVLISTDSQANEIVTNGLISSEFGADSDPRGTGYRVLFERPLQTEAGQRYYLTVYPDDPNRFFSAAGPVQLGYYTSNGTYRQALPEPVETVQQNVPLSITFRAKRSGELSAIQMPAIVDWQANDQPKTLQLSLSGPDGNAVSEITSDFLAGSSQRGQSYSFEFDPVVNVEQGQDYRISLDMTAGQGILAFYGSRQALESSWDDPLPYGLEEYSVFDYYYGLYRTDLNFEMYWDDNEEKRQRFLSILDQADTIFISSGRQWGTTTRVPERYPLTTEYYRSLIGCPDEQDVVWCYRTAEPGMFQGSLGFELIKTFTSDPQIGPWRFNTQFAEEAFTVYDHPKVMIFKKTNQYDPQQVNEILGSVDLSRVVHVTPRQASQSSASASTNTLLLPEERLNEQRAGGTWSELFDRSALFNRYPALAAVLWYVVVTLLGWMMFPFTRLALGSLADRGYPLVRLIGMVVLAYLTWLLGSYGVPFSQGTITGVAAVLLILNIGLALLQRDGLRKEWRERRRYFLTVEAITLLFFLLFLAVRLGNPDLWHPSKGGEKPMDFSYLNAVLKSTTFPPYDPWFAGGYINYYYYGFVLVGVLVKWMGIVPSIAYNLILPALFSMLAMAAFSFGWNVIAGHRQARDDTHDDIEAATEVEPVILGLPRASFLAGIFSAVGLLILGNLGTVRMIWHGIQRLAANGSIEGVNIFQRIIWTFQGLLRLIEGQNLPYGMGEWYWNPSRAIPGSPITEFPFFTFLYADLHAHMMALPVTVLALVWALSILRGRWQWTWLQFGASFLLGGMAIGALRPSNTWDMPAYLALGAAAVFYTAFRYSAPFERQAANIPVWIRRAAAAVFSAGLLVVLAFVLYQPFAQWYAQAYSSIGILEIDERTPIWSYLTHWGLFLFVIASWLFWETWDWMDQSSLSHAVRYAGWIKGLLVALVITVVALLLLEVEIAWLVLPLAAWAAVLLLRPGQPDEKRAVLFLVGSGLFLTLLVEVVVLRGDITRMNTVFKFYLQAWTMLSLAAAAGLVWLLPSIKNYWSSGWRNGWQVALIALVFGAALFPLIAGTDKIRDRMSRTAPHTLDGMTYMAYSRYADFGQEMNLNEDYQAIIWMQENVEGSPVIVEGHASEYRWGSRYTIYTGLPGVVGWNWHQRQQRGVVSPTWVTDRVEQIAEFYETVDADTTTQFLQRYTVEYVVVGQYERAMYSPLGLIKFEEWNGILWDEVYRYGSTVIYRVK